MNLQGHSPSSQPLRQAKRFPLTMPDLHRFAAFLVVAEELHFGRAAKLLMMSPSSLSRLVSCFEDDLGIKVFERNRHAVHLTQAGQRLIIDTQGLLDHANDVLRRVQGLDIIE